MKPVQAIPEDYSLAWNVDMKRNLRLNVLLQILGTFWLGLVGVIFWWLIRQLRPDLGLLEWLSAAPVSLLGFVLALVFSITAHELVHGLFFWGFTGRRPAFGIGPGYAFAAMPGWYFQRNQYLVIGLAPLLALTALGLGLLPFLPVWLVVPVFWGLVINGGGSIGDLYICWRIAREAPDVFVQDQGDGFEVYRRGG